ncbi:hypothetical protein ABIE50_004401 [Chitinophaga sp. OAE865]
MNTAIRAVLFRKAGTAGHAGEEAAALCDFPRSFN